MKSCPHCNQPIHKKQISNTKEKFIHYIDATNRFRIRVKREDYYEKTLEDAIKTRDRILEIIKKKEK